MGEKYPLSFFPEVARVACDQKQSIGEEAAFPVMLALLSVMYCFEVLLLLSFCLPSYNGK